MPSLVPAPSRDSDAQVFELFLAPLFRQQGGGGQVVLAGAIGFARDTELVPVEVGATDEKVVVALWWSEARWRSRVQTTERPVAEVSDRICRNSDFR